MRRHWMTSSSNPWSPPWAKSQQERRQWRLPVNSRVRKLQGQMESLLKSTSLEVRPPSTGSPVGSKFSVRKRAAKTSNMPTSYMYKDKGEKTACENLRGISLLRFTGKILPCIFLNKIIGHQVSESQCSFRQNRGTVDMVFAFRQLQEKMYWIVPRLVSALQRPHKGLWHCQHTRPLVHPIQTEMPPNFSRAVHSSHDGMMARVIENGYVSELFSVTNGVWPQHASAFCSPKCSQLHYSIPKLASRSSTGHMDVILTCVIWRPTPKCEKHMSVTSSSQMIACNTLLIVSQPLWKPLR